MKIRSDFSAVIRQAREAKGLQQEALATLLGVSPDTIRNWEKERSTPSLSIRPLLEQALEISLQEGDEQKAQSDTHPLQAEHQDAKRTSFSPMRWMIGDENRRRMLNRVHFLWIKGVLNAILSQSTLIGVGLQEQPLALEYSWQAEEQATARLPQHYPAGTSIVQVYDTAEGELLILGEPGAGKTTLLLELTNVLLERARHNELHPIPVVFHLSSWTEKRLPLIEWLLEELQQKYQVPYALGAAWIADDRLILLLDGLDEIAVAHQPTCILEMNRYREEHALVSVVVCCRSASYFEQTGRFQLKKAVEIQPLLLRQINQYLTSAGKPLAGLRAALRTDPVLREVVATPLMLSACAMVYHNKTQKEIALRGDQEEWRRSILEQYVTLAWQRGSRASPSYSAERVTSLLAWLARQMRAHGQTEFYLERLQPDWLEEKKAHMLYQKWVARILLCISFFIQATLFACFRGDTEPDVPGLFFWLGSSAHGNTILGWMAPGVGGGLGGGGSLGLIIFVVQALAGFFVEQKGSTQTLLGAILHNLFGALRVSLLIGSGTALLVIAVLALVQKSLTYGIQHGIGIGIYAGLSFGLIWLIGRGDGREKPVYVLKRSLGDRLLDTVLYFLSGFCGMFWWYALQAGSPEGNPFRAALCVGVGLAVMWGPTTMTERLIKAGIIIQPAEVSRWNWSSMARNIMPGIKRGMVLGAAIALPTIVVLVIMSSLFNNFSYAWRYGLIYGLIVGCMNGIAALLTSLLNSGWHSDMMPDPHQLTQPNEGIHRSYKHALFAAGVFAPIGGIISGIGCGICFWLAGVPGWFFLMVGLGVVSGIGLALQFWNAYGGRAWIEHYLLRWFLWRKDDVPQRCREYLDEAVRRTLLRKMGAGYMFSHQLFQDYFAKQ
ncbi:NACHT domain-containing protein [Reticulibacter mediterranei]|nr:helix-turn-helix domain-containing protein [Reticulibacter mediterranei]